ncbi:MAG: peptidase M52 [Anaerolinea sp.]|nr:peptidase M52 [Anaerolinea sp.]
MKTIVIGLGNPILGDDGVGWEIAAEVSRKLGIAVGESKVLESANPDTPVDIECFSLGGLSLMERLTGYQRVILIDAIFTGQKPIGTVTTFPLSALPNPSAGHSTAAHDTSLCTALDVGRSMDIPLPEDDQVTIVAIEAENVYDFSEKLSPPVEVAVPVAVAKVLELLNK